MMEWLGIFFGTMIMVVVLTSLILAINKIWRKDGLR